MKIEHLSESLLEISQHSHDLQNAFGATKLALGVVEEVSVRGESAGPEFDQAVALLRSSVDRTDRALGSIRSNPVHPASGPTVELEPVSVGQCLEELRASLLARFPSAILRLEVDGPDDVAMFRGGRGSAERVLENLVLNALQGDGTRGAKEVVVRVSASGERTVVVDVEDDGPGFSSPVLDRPITAFETTKAEGTGVGLFTAAGIARASHGRLQRSNRHEGGARVRLELLGRSE